MSYKIKAWLIGLLSTIMLVGFLPSAASAAQYFVETETVSAITNLQGSSGKSTLSTEVLKIKVSITCNEDTLSGTLKPEGKSTATIELKGCSDESAASCKVKEPIKLEAKDKLVAGETAVEDEFEPLTGETFGTIVLESKEKETCALKGTYSVTGTQTCALPKGEEKLTEHEVVCTTANDHLKIDGAAGTFTSTEKVHLESKKGFGEFEISQDALTAVGGGTELNFTGLGANTRKEIKIENVGLSTAYLKEEWIEEGGVRNETNFEIVEAMGGAGVNVCRNPFTTSDEEVLGVRDWCNVGVKFKTGTAGLNAAYVVKVSCFWGYFWCGRTSRMNIKS